MTSGSGGAHGKRKSPRIIVKSVPCKPLDVDMQPIDAVRLVSAFGTAEPSFATLMLIATGTQRTHPNQKTLIMPWPP